MVRQIAFQLQRDRENAADAANQYAIAEVRTFGPPGPGLMPSGPYGYSLPPNNTAMHVDCLPVPTRTFSGFRQTNVVFTACVGPRTGVTCGTSGRPIIIRAQVNFQATASSTVVVVTRTWVQSWSVNG